MMINLLLNRITISKTRTLGNLRVDGRDTVFATLEPQGLDLTVKPRSIPAGTYRVSLRKSPRLGYVTPYLHDVPGFSDVLIHIGNFPQDTLGCILVGLDIVGQAIEHSRTAFDALMGILSSATPTIDGIVATITITNPDNTLLV